MQKIARFIVKHHGVIFAFFMVAAVVCAVMSLHVKVNTDMTKYLPANMQVRQGMTLMSSEFGDACTINLSAKVPEGEREKFSEDLADFDVITNVEYEEDDAFYNNGDYALFVLSASGDAYSDEAASAVNVARGACASRGYECWVDSQALDSATNGLGPILVAAVAIAVVILLVLADSWIEPLLLLFVILIAVLLNMGSNLVFGQISDTTSACSAVLQMALSMDYLIMLLNRYRLERAPGVRPEQAMERAITGGMTAIAASSVTTIVGLLCLAPMSFTIGADLGLVLAKGVVLSLVCALACMPALVLWLDDAMQRFTKPSLRPRLRTLARVSFKGRYVLLAVFVVVFAVGFSMKGLTSASFLAQSKNADRAVVYQQFNPDKQLVVLYPASQEEAAQNVASQLEGRQGVRKVTSYSTTVGKPYTAAALAEELDLDEPLVKMVYYSARCTQTLPMTGRVLASYIRNGLEADLGDLLDSDTADKLESFASLVEENLEAGRSYTASQAASALADHPSIHESTLNMVYLAYAANTAGSASQTMTTYSFMDYLANTMLDDERYQDMFTSSTRAELRDAFDTVQDAKDRLVGANWGRIILGVTYADDSDEMDALVTQLRQQASQAWGEGSYYLVGQGPMVQEMRAAFPGEMNFITLITIAAILLIVLLAFRNLFVPILLVATVQGAYSWDMAIVGMAGMEIYYVAMLVVQSILMGAAIDYAILFTTNYREARQAQGVAVALATAYRTSVRTVMMSGSILVLVCLALGLTAGGITGQVCLTISLGAACAVVLVMLVLPGTIAALDRFVAGRGAVRSR